MAIDTREKRQAAALVGVALVPPTVTVNTSKDQEWRQEVGWGYPGVETGTVITGTTVTLTAYGGRAGRMTLRGGTSAAITLKGGTSRRLELR